MLLTRLKRYPDKFLGVCRINPEDPDAPDHLSRWTEEDGFHGVAAQSPPSVRQATGLRAP